MVQDANLAPRQSGSREDGIAEVLLCNHLTTTESEENAARLDGFKPFHIQPRIAFQGVV